MSNTDVLNQPLPGLRLNIPIIRVAMRQHGIANYPQLAERLQISRATLNRQIVGREQPSAVTLAGLALHLGLSLSQTAITTCGGGRHRA